MRPTGEPEVLNRTPEECGKYVADYVWQEMHAPPLDYEGFFEAVSMQLGTSEEGIRSGRNLMTRFANVQYGYADACRDLVIEPKREGQ